MPILLANDFDVEDGEDIQNLTLDKFVFSNPSKGVIVRDAVNGTITYTPNKNYNGSDVIYYQIKDSSGTLSNKAAINLKVNAVNDAPNTLVRRVINAIRLPLAIVLILKVEVPIVFSLVSIAILVLNPTL